MNKKNEILEEIWNARKKIEEENNGDIEAIYQRYYQKQHEKPAEYVTGEPVRIKRTNVA
jgi:hypothetical protein